LSHSPHFRFIFHLFVALSDKSISYPQVLFELVILFDF
jgi:hypothetical protein